MCISADFVFEAICLYLSQGPFKRHTNACVRSNNFNRLSRSVCRRHHCTDVRADRAAIKTCTPLDVEILRSEQVVLTIWTRILRYVYTCYLQCAFDTQHVEFLLQEGSTPHTMKS